MTRVKNLSNPASSEPEILRRTSNSPKKSGSQPNRNSSSKSFVFSNFESKKTIYICVKAIFNMYFSQSSRHAARNSKIQICSKIMPTKFGNILQSAVGTRLSCSFSRNHFFSPFGSNYFNKDTL